MSLSDKDRKSLWAQAGNRCSYRFENSICNNLLVVTDNGKQINVGEECHIVGKNPGSARYLEDYLERETYNNMILMCPKHHKIIDDHEEIYTAEILRAMKDVHGKAVLDVTDNINSIVQSSPNLSIKLIHPDDRSQTKQSNITFNLPENPNSWTGNFGLVLENLTPSSVIKGLIIKLSISWGGGEHLKKAPIFNVPNELKALGWETKPNLLVNEHPAILKFKDTDFICASGHPEEWSNFRFTINEPWIGMLNLAYKISSIEPFTEHSGNLQISISHQK